MNVVVTLISLSFGTSMLIVSTWAPRAMPAIPTSASYAAMENEMRSLPMVRVLPDQFAPKQEARNSSRAP
ncbi:hypothetical protein D3C81_1870240 [compost metagenome]